jgi:hypothetical protein
MSEAIPKRHRQRKMARDVVLNTVTRRPGERVLL